MNGLYLLINIASFSIPFVFSFHPKIRFYKEWKYVVPGIFISGIVYLIWDAIFTFKGIWGFNPAYISGISIFNLPIEEVLFFIAIPYASLFTHFCITKFYPNSKLSISNTRRIGAALILLLLIISVVFREKDYTFVNAICTSIILLLSLALKPIMLSRFLVTYLFVLVPFFMVNGVLTGSFIEGEVVWYNNAENLGIRLGTIPVEDLFYGLGMLLLAQLLASLFKRGVKNNDFPKS